MSKILFQRLISENKKFFKPSNKKTEGILFLDLQTNDFFLIITLMKLGKAVAETLNFKLVVLSSVRYNKESYRLIESYLPHKIVNALSLFLRGVFFKFFHILDTVLSFNTGEDLSAYKYQVYDIGKHIYDGILRRQCISSIKRITIKQKLIIFFELAFFYGFLHLFKKEKFSYGILADNVYRQGLIFEVFKQNVVPSIAGIDINGISMHRYKTAGDYELHCRSVEWKLVKKIVNDNQFVTNINNYVDVRFSGQLKQHDLKRAYSNQKITMDKNSLIDLYDLDYHKKNIIVMAHIFCDAPHAYPDMKFIDYEDWLENTCIELSNNPNINLLIKKHPSTSLYKEDGKIEKVLTKHNLRNRLLDDNINTKSLFDFADAIVTCGGTAGLEFPCFGVPVIVASKPPYSTFSYIKTSDTKDDYYTQLGNIHNVQKLTVEEISLAKAVLYIMNCLIKIPGKDIGLSNQAYYLDSKINYDLLFKEMIDDCKDGAGYQYLKKKIDLFLFGEYSNLLDL